MSSLLQHSYIARLRRKLEQRGFSQASHLLLVKCARKLTLFKILRGMRLCDVDPDYLKCPSRYTAGFLDEAQLRQYARDPQNELDNSFLSEALAKGDRCYAILEGEKLAAYGWYSCRPTRIDPPDLVLSFNQDYVYMYKGLTHPAYRGQRLHAIGMNLALQSYMKEGLTGMISYVESTNFDSLKSCARLGYQIFGSIYLVRVFGRYLHWRSPACKHHGFTLYDTTPCADGWGARKA
ncbi:GNAT family N-acetyltransferase [Pseudomonas sp. B392_1p]|uniref:GNAT family N-acetyltransferase n=1 Tax=Pseudomonas sp. B392_1p TaxID=3457507 RepID=UPI003FD2BAA1